MTAQFASDWCADSQSVAAPRHGTQPRTPSPLKHQQPLQLHTALPGLPPLLSRVDRGPRCLAAWLRRVTHVAAGRWFRSRLQLDRDREPIKSLLVLVSLSRCIFRLTHPPEMMAKIGAVVARYSEAFSSFDAANSHWIDQLESLHHQAARLEEVGPGDAMGGLAESGSAAPVCGPQRAAPPPAKTASAPDGPSRRTRSSARHVRLRCIVEAALPAVRQWNNFAPRPNHG